MHNHFLTWPRSWSHLLSTFHCLITKLHGKTFWCFWFDFSVFYTFFFIFQKTEVPIHLAWTFFTDNFDFSEHIISPCSPWFVYFKNVYFLKLLLVRIFRLLTTTTDFFLDSLDFPVIFWWGGRREREKTHTFELVPEGLSHSPSPM